MAAKSKGYSVFRVFNVIIMLLIIVITLFPVLNILAKSFSDMKNLTQNTVNIYPKGFDVNTYQTIISDDAFGATTKTP